MAEAAPTAYLLHRRVWTNDYQGLDDLLKAGDTDKEELDGRGR